MRVPIGVPGGGVWGRVQVGGGGGFPVENEGKRICQNYPLANYPLANGGGFVNSTCFVAKQGNRRVHKTPRPFSKPLRAQLFRPPPRTCVKVEPSVIVPQLCSSFRVKIGACPFEMQYSSESEHVWS